MRILHFSDIHGDKSKLSQICEHIKDVDIVVGTGDYVPLANYRSFKERYKTSTEFAEYLCTTLKVYSIPVILITGNDDFPKSRVKEIFTKHGVKTIDGCFQQNIIDYETIAFCHIRTPPEIILEHSKKNKEKDIVLLSHKPPYGVLDENKYGHHGGDEGNMYKLKKIPGKRNIRAYLFGHIHYDETACIAPSIYMSHSSRILLSKASPCNFNIIDIACGTCEVIRMDEKTLETKIYNYRVRPPAPENLSPRLHCQTLSLHPSAEH